MAELLKLKVGDHITGAGDNWGNCYEVSEWPDDPANDFIRVRELRPNGDLEGRSMSYNKSMLSTKSWQYLSSREGRQIRSVGRHIALLGKDATPEIHELLFRLEI